MTRPEVEKIALELPDSDRAALVGTLIQSLNEAGVAALRKLLATGSALQMEVLASRLEAQIGEWFQGAGAEWTDERWRALERGEYRHPFEAGSLAVPPGWQPPREGRGD